MPVDLIDNAISKAGSSLYGIDTREYFKKEYDAHLYDNQIKSVDIITDPTNHFILLDEARGGGKTFGVSVAAHYLCSKIKKLMITAFGPKFAQGKRILGQIADVDNGIIDKKSSSTTHLVFKNGSEIIADSANEKANIEGGHPHIIILDERHKMSDAAVSNKIMPMLGAHKYWQLIEMGVSLGRNGFFQDSQDPKFMKVFSDWLHCDRLKESGIILHKGKQYPRFVSQIMPWEKKLQYFGEDAEMLVGKKGTISLLDFVTQYELQWLEDIANFLSDDQQKKLIGEHEELQGYDNSGIAMFGCDTAGGSVDPEKLGLDFTALSIWIKRRNVIEKVASFKFQGHPMPQYRRIKEILKNFKVIDGVIDYSNIGINFVNQLQEDGINCQGVMYRMTDPETRKNMKMTMFEYFQDMITKDMVKYPKIFGGDGEVLVTPEMYEAYIQWTIFERKVKNGKTIDLSAPSGEHDDFPNSDVLCVHGFKTSKQTGIDDSGSDFYFGGMHGGLISR